MRVPYVIVANELFSNIARVPKGRLEHVVQTSNPDELDLIKKLLIYDPSRRITVDQALRHPFVKQFANPKEEIGIPTPPLSPPDYSGHIAIQMNDNTQYRISEYRELLYHKNPPRKSVEQYQQVKNKINDLINKQKKYQSSLSSFNKYLNNQKLIEDSQHCLNKMNQKEEKEIIIDQLNQEFDTEPP